MDPHQAAELLWDFERASASPENNNIEINPFSNVFDFSMTQPDLSLHRPGFRMSDGSSNVGGRGPLASPTNLAPGNNSMNHGGLFPSLLQPFNPFLSNYSQNNSGASIQTSSNNVIMRAPMRSPLSHFAFFEESTSTDATPESSDVEDEARPKKKKRSKALMSEEQATKHTEDAQRFPAWLSEVRGKLASESPDGRVQEIAAVTALIQEFKRCDETHRFYMPMHCEEWLKQAAESVQERRQMNKGMRKKRSADALFTGGPSDKFYCSFCTEHDAKAYKTQEGLNLHIRNKHEADKPWKCFAPGCTVSFVRQADLRMHLIRMHSPQRPFPCKVPFCLKAFAGVSELRRHVKVDHRNVVQHLCGMPHPALY